MNIHAPATQPALHSKPAWPIWPGRIAEGLEALIELPASMTHSAVEKLSLAVDPRLVRLSVGPEHVDDLLTDLEITLD